MAESTRALGDDPSYTKAYERRAASLFELGESEGLLELSRGPSRLQCVDLSCLALIVLIVNLYAGSVEMAISFQRLWVGKGDGPNFHRVTIRLLGLIVVELLYCTVLYCTVLFR